MNESRSASHASFGRPASPVLVVTVLVVAWAGSGCARRSPSPFGGQRSEEPIRLEIENGNYLDVTVYVMPDGASHRIGQVTGASSTTLVVPRSLVPASGRFRLLVSPIGSREAYLSEDILAMPGDVVQLRVASVLRMSSWSVRRDGAPIPAPARRPSPAPRDRPSAHRTNAITISKRISTTIAISRYSARAEVASSYRAV